MMSYNRRFPNSTRSDHLLGNTYPILLDIHANLKELKHLADHIDSFRSGNVELGVSEDWKLQFKYTASETWNIIGDLRDLILYGSSGAAGEINGAISALADRLSAVETSLSTLTDSVGTQDTDITSLKSSVTSIDLSITTINNSASLLALSVTSLTEAVDVLERDKAAKDLEISSLISRIEALETAGA